MNLVRVHPPRVAGDLACQVRLYGRLDVSAGEHDFQAGSLGFLIGRGSHAAADQHPAAGNGGEHIFMTVGMPLAAFRMAAVMGFGECFAPT